MYLSKVKLSGFKSFVDHTVFELTGRLNGIVGPNGCGKSNIIDAIRWVMGESSAKQLRGESMTDVIFSGATSRKASSFASIELVFDNSDGKIGGQWAAFSELSIKRVLDRSGQSSYFLNGARCRRRDITDIFLGTGLGSRSYAIIEQGMISRIVESKPDELRLVFEEAASVSKYKEQRRETETRVEHTRSNLLRLLDVREELSKQLDVLEQQAKKAEEYQVLKREERMLQYLSLKQRKETLEDEQSQLKTRIEALQKEFHDAVNFYNDLVIKYNHHKSEWAEKSELLTQKNEAVHVRKTEVLTIQHKIESLSTLKTRTEADIHEISDQLEQIAEELSQKESEWDALMVNQSEMSAEFELMNEDVASAQEDLQRFVSEYEGVSESLKQLQIEMNGLERKADVAKNSIAHHETQQVNNDGLLQKLEEELIALDDQNDLSSERVVLEETLAEKQQALEIQLTSKEAYQAQAIELNDTLNRITEEIHQSLRKTSEYEGRLSALALLQNALVAQDEEVVTPLYSALAIQPKWQIAVESVLSKWLTLSTSQHSGGYVLGQETYEFTPNHLGYYVDSDLNLGALLSHVYILQSLDELKQKQLLIEPHEWLVLENGDLYGKDWFLPYRKNEVEGVLERAKEMSQLESELNILETTRALSEEKKQEISEKNIINNQMIASIQKEIESEKQEIIELEKKLSLLTKEHAYKTENRTRLLTQLKTLKEGHLNGQEMIETERMELEEVLLLLEEKQIESADLTEKQENLFAQKKMQEAHYQSLSQKVMEKRRALDQIEYQIKEYGNAKARLITQQEVLLQKRIEKSEELHLDEESALLEESLILANEALSELEIEKNELNTAVASLQETLNQEEQLKTSQENHIASQKEMIQSLIVREAEYKTHTEHVEESWDALLETLSEDEKCSLSQEMLSIEEENIESLLKSVQNKLNRMGAVNLIAIEECKTLRERKTYLDEQDRDLNQALDELEEAIRKIDKETKERFMDTFNTVNQDFSKLFPQLFGGGEAYLELKGEDALVSGVNIIARPPGKKPGTIHLLSGGEKALTAAALVFAIFNLNPAPFCILDEVDAPLDEANVRRLGKLLQEMSDKVQFIFITHNKTTMSIAESLIGVTMSEPGVSRLVSVDLAEAERIAE